MSCQEARAHTRLHHVASSVPAAYTVGEALERGHALEELPPPCIGLVGLDRAPQPINAGVLLPSSTRASGPEHETSAKVRLPHHPHAADEADGPQRLVTRTKCGQRLAAFAARGFVTSAGEVRVPAGWCPGSGGPKTACKPNGMVMVMVMMMTTQNGNS